MTKRSDKLRVIEPLELPPDWEIRPGVPATRADCASLPRPCPHVACRHHLFLRLEQEQAGNPRLGRQGETTLRAPTMHSCALDVASEASSCERIAALLGIDATRVRQIAKRALQKLRFLGIDTHELLGAL